MKEIIKNNEELKVQKSTAERVIVSTNFIIKILFFVFMMAGFIFDKMWLGSLLIIFCLIYYPVLITFYNIYYKLIKKQRIPEWFNKNIRFVGSDASFLKGYTESKRLRDDFLRRDRKYRSFESSPTIKTFDYSYVSQNTSHRNR